MFTQSEGEAIRSAIRSTTRDDITEVRRQELCAIVERETSAERFFAGSARHLVEPWSTPLEFPHGGELQTVVSHDGVPILGGTYRSSMGADIITLIEIKVHGIRGGRPLKIRPWATVDAIADFVNGDGDDAQRVALADGIRQGWSE